MRAQDIDEDFAACDTEMLNRFFASYLKTHTMAARTRCSATSRTSSPG
jgi:hypothetical protein